MNTIERIEKRAEEKKRSNAFLCEKMGVARVYFNDIKKSGRAIPDDKLAIIAQELETTVEYLRGETDEPEKNSALIDLSDLSPAKRAMILVVLNTEDGALEQKMLEWQKEKKPTEVG